MASWGIRLIFVDISGLSKFKVGGSIFVCSDLKENTASTAPAAPSKWPMADLFELINNNKTKAKILWDLKLGITAKDFSDGKLEDYFKVEELKSHLHHVGEGTEESRDFKDAITLEDIPGEFVLSFETDGSMTPRTAFNMAVKELAGKFNIIEQDTKAVL